MKKIGVIFECRGVPKRSEHCFKYVLGLGGEDADTLRVSIADVEYHWDIRHVYYILGGGIATFYCSKKEDTGKNKNRENRARMSK